MLLVRTPYAYCVSAISYRRLIAEYQRSKSRIKLELKIVVMMVKVQHDQLKEWFSIIVNIVKISVVLICGHYVHIQRESATSSLVKSNLYNHPDEHKAQGNLTVRKLVTVFLLIELVTPKSGFFASNILKN